MGIITAIGDSVAENHTALKEGKCGIGKLMRHFPSRYAGLLPFGEVPHTTTAVCNRLGVNEYGVTRTCILALHAFKEAIASSGLDAATLAEPGTALISATTVGGMCLTDELYTDAQAVDKGSEYLRHYDSASVNFFIQQHHPVGGIVNIINTACSSSANAIMFGARLIQQGLAKRAIVGGVDCMAKFTVNGFNALHILSDEQCTPFDQRRKGLNLGEGAAFLVLEREEDCAGKKIYARLSGYANSNDAFHPSSLSDEGDGPFLSMQEALTTAGLKPGDIAYINAHGTGTENNDLVESRAMMRLFPVVPPFSSTKTNVGHTLGAAGAVEAVYSILSLVHQEVYPHLHFAEPIEETKLLPATTYGHAVIGHVMSNSFGFGGNCSSLIFSKA